MHQLTILSVFIFFVVCTGCSTEDSKQASLQGVQEALSNPKQTLRDSLETTKDIDIFWGRFQRAVVQKDVQELVFLSDTAFIKISLFDELFFQIFEHRITQSQPHSLRPSKEDKQVFFFSFEEKPTVEEMKEGIELFGATLFFHRNSKGLWKLFEMQAYG
jgi:hypothetical protein